MKRKKEKERNRKRALNPATLNPPVISYNPQRSHNEPILLTPPPPGPKNIKNIKYISNKYYKQTKGWVTGKLKLRNLKNVTPF